MGQHFADAARLTSSTPLTWLLANCGWDSHAWTLSIDYMGDVKGDWQFADCVWFVINLRMQTNYDACVDISGQI